MFEAMDVLHEHSAERINHVYMINLGSLNKVSSRDVSTDGEPKNRFHKLY